MIWVYEDVLPSIRKTGSYSAQPSSAPVHQPLDDPFRYLKPILGEEMYNELTKRASKSVEPDILTFYGRRVWTLQMLADLYGMKKQTIYWTMKGNLFERPAEWFVTNHLQKRQLCVEGKHFFTLNGKKLWTRRGLAHFAFIIETPEAWAIYKEMERVYLMTMGIK